MTKKKKLTLQQMMYADRMTAEDIANLSDQRPNRINVFERASKIKTWNMFIHLVEQENISPAQSRFWKQQLSHLVIDEYPLYSYFITLMKVLCVPKVCSTRVGRVSKGLVFLPPRFVVFLVFQMFTIGFPGQMKTGIDFFCSPYSVSN